MSFQLGTEWEELAWKWMNAREKPELSWNNEKCHFKFSEKNIRRAALSFFFFFLYWGESCITSVRYMHCFTNRTLNCWEPKPSCDSVICSTEQPQSSPGAGFPQEVVCVQGIQCTAPLQWWLLAWCEILTPFVVGLLQTTVIACQWVFKKCSDDVQVATPR